MVKAFTVRIYIHEESKNCASNQITSRQISIQHFRNHLEPSYEQNLFISTAIVQIKLYKKLPAFKTTYLNKHALSRTQCYEIKKMRKKRLNFHFKVKLSNAKNSEENWQAINEL